MNRERYRTAFFFSLVLVVGLAAALAYLLWRQAGTPLRPVTVTPVAVSGSAPEPKLAPVDLTPQRIQTIGVKTGEVALRNVQDELLTTGNVEADETTLADVQVRFAGWVRKVFVNSTYQRVHKGQPLLTVYSPDLVITEQEYLLARQNGGLLLGSSVEGVATGAKSLIDAAEARLRQFEVPDREIARLRSAGTIQQALEMDSPADGYVTDRKALPNMYVQPGATLYSIADLSRVWVYAQVFQDDLGRVRVGNPAEITVDAYPGRTFHGRVSFIWPELDPATRTAKVRIEATNPGMMLSLGMFVNVRIVLPMGRRLTIPASGAYQTGARWIAFLDAGGGHYVPREIQVGPRAGDDLVVLSGLKAGDRIVTSANFLLDSESQIESAMNDFAPPSSASAPTTGAAQSAQIDLSTNPATPRKGDNTIRAVLRGADGKPIDGADVAVTFFQPAMPEMGMAATRLVTALKPAGNGVYAGSIRLPSGGAWRITVTAARAGQPLARRDLSVTAEGGM
jgi:RND family efflux transporter MFP subunit